MPWNTDFRPILTLILIEISAWNIMFHGCLFDDNCLVLCILLGWLLWAGLLNKKVHICGALLGRILNLLKAFLCLLVSCRARPGIPSYPRSRDVTCYVWWSEYGIAGQARKDTVNERFGKNLEGLSKASRRKSAPNWCKKQWFSLRKPTPLFIKLG